jgi:peptidoglycan/xylan/chitin deacetylase (PgdA/CDA1 family)
MENSKRKVLTFSYDDGTTQDIRLAELFHKYGMKATFNLNSAKLGQERELLREGVTIRHDKVRAADVEHIYAGHEIAAHTMTHPSLLKLDDAEVIREVEQDRLALSELCGYEVVGFAYPGGHPNYNTHIADVIRENTGIKYCRTVLSSHSFEAQKNLYEFRPTVHHHAEWDALFALGEQFLALPAGTDALFYAWGHAFEFDIRDTWGRFEEFLQMMAGKNDIAYLTNKEAFFGKD